MREVRGAVAEHVVRCTTIGDRRQSRLPPSLEWSAGKEFTRNGHGSQATSVVLEAVQRSHVVDKLVVDDARHLSDDWGAAGGIKLANVLEHGGGKVAEVGKGVVPLDVSDPRLKGGRVHRVVEPVLWGHVIVLVGAARQVMVSSEVHKDGAFARPFGVWDFQVAGGSIGKVNSTRKLATVGRKFGVGGHREDGGAAARSAPRRREDTNAVSCEERIDDSRDLPDPAVST